MIRQSVAEDFCSMLLKASRMCENIWQCCIVEQEMNLKRAGLLTNNKYQRVLMISSSLHTKQVRSHHRQHFSGFLLWFDLLCHSPLTNVLLNVCADNEANVSSDSLLIPLALLIFHWKCFQFWLWGQISKTQLYACCQTEALMMTKATGVGDTSELPVNWQRSVWEC